MLKIFKVKNVDLSSTKEEAGSSILAFHPNFTVIMDEVATSLIDNNTLN